jgi:hypothetical protein
MQAAWTTNCKHTTTTEQTWPTRAHKLSPWSPARLFQHWRPTGHCAPGMTHAPPSSLTAASPCDVDAPLRVATEFLWAAPSPCSMHASMRPGPPSSIASLISADQFSVWRHRSQIDRCHRCHPFARRGMPYVTQKARPPQMHWWNTPSSSWIASRLSKHIAQSVTSQLIKFQGVDHRKKTPLFRICSS